MIQHHVIQTSRFMAAVAKAFEDAEVQPFIPVERKILDHFTPKTASSNVPTGPVTIYSMDWP